ncbi:MAG: putative mannose-sensitive agglutinin [Burkholderiales bacterium]|nr:putative mannose-sensitive agglutinin [Burkholderiales bacterium]
MSQQINLYSPLFRKQKKIFSGVAMAQATTLVVVGVLAFYAYVSLQTSLLEIRVVDSGQRVRAEIERLKVYSTTESPEVRAKALAEQKKKLEAALAERTRTVQALAESGLGRSDGYSASLRALARLSMQGVWLTRVQFAEKEGEVALVGLATHPELVAAYLERLRKEEALRGQAFSRLDIRRPATPERPGVVEFTLSSAAPAPQGRK